MKLIFITLFFVFCWSSTSTSEALPAMFRSKVITSLPNDVVDFASRVEKKEFFTADFEQTKKLQILQKPLVSKGLFVFADSYGFVWDLEEPIKSTTIITKKKLVQREPGKTSFSLERASDQTLNELTNIFFLLFDAKFEALQSQFKMYFQKHQDYWLLGLVPHSEPMSKLIQAIELRVSKDLDEIKIWETNKDRTRITFGPQSESDKSTIIENYFG